MSKEKDQAEAITDTAATSNGETGAENAGAKQGPSQATKIVELAGKHFRMLLGDDGAPYAVRLEGPNIALPMRGRDGVRQMLARLYYQAHKAAASSSALTDALAVLAGEAAEQDREAVELRLARHGDGIVIDLGTADGRCVIVRPGSWSVAPVSPVLFRRTALTGEMVTPIAGGKLDELFPLVNAGEAEVKLLIGWLIAGFIPDLPHPILTVLGEQGTAKTTLMRLLSRLIDPSPAPTRTAPRDLKSWAVTASASWLIPLDNISTVSDWQSDAYCRAVTGDALTDRALYTDADVSVMAFRRLLALTSIDAGAVRGDLGDRMLPIELDRIAPHARRTDQDVTARFDAAAPEIVGALFDLLAAVLAKLPTVTAKTLPRMADFARVLVALDEVHGWTTVADYAATATDIAETVIDSDPFAVAVRDLAHRKGEWTGTSAELRNEITPEKPPRDWPKTPRAVGGAVRRITPALRQVGVTVDHGREAGGSRTRTITLRADRDGRDGGGHLLSVQGETSGEGAADCYREPPSEPSRPSRQACEQQELRDGWGRLPSHPAPAPSEVGRSGPQPSHPDTASDLRERETRDGRDGRDADSHSESGCDVCDGSGEVDGDVCGDCWAAGRVVA